jgi:hypothetical protein
MSSHADLRLQFRSPVEIGMVEIRIGWRNQLIGQSPIGESRAMACPEATRNRFAGELPRYTLNPTSAVKLNPVSVTLLPFALIDGGDHERQGRSHFPRCLPRRRRSRALDRR